MTNIRWIFALIAVLVVGAASVVLVNGYQERRAIQAEQQAIVLRGERDAAIRAANEENSKRTQIEAYIKASESRVSVARSKVASHGPKKDVPALPPDEVLGLVNDQDVLIQELDNRDVLKEQKIASLEAENEALRRALEASMKREVAQEIAAKASSEYRYSVTGLAGYDAERGPVYGARVSVSRGNLTGGAGFIGRTAFVEFGFRFGGKK